ARPSTKSRSIGARGWRADWRSLESSPCRHTARVGARRPGPPRRLAIAPALPRPAQGPRPRPGPEGRSVWLSCGRHRRVFEAREQISGRARAEELPSRSQKAETRMRATPGEGGRVKAYQGTYFLVGHSQLGTSRIG